MISRLFLMLILTPFFALFSLILSGAEIGMSVVFAENVLPLRKADVKEVQAKTVYYVSPDGNDSNAGTEAKPFQTIEKARDQIRLERLSSENNGPWRVQLLPGIFSLKEPIIFTADDSGTPDAPIVYAGTEGETIFSGGIALTGWKAEVDGTWSVDIPVSEKTGQKEYFEQLFVNSERAVRARYPNQGFLLPQAVFDELPREKNVKQIKSFTKQTLTAKPDELSFLNDIPADELKWGQLVVHHHWDTTRRILLAFDKTAGVISTQGEPMKSWNPWRPTSQYYIENVRTAFDQPGEWFYDGEAGKVFYRPLPGQTLETTTFLYPKSGFQQFLVLDSSAEQPISDIRFEKIIFELADTPRRLDVMKKAELPTDITGDLNFSGPSQFEPAQAASYTKASISVDHACRIGFSQCQIRNIGEYAFWLRNTENCFIECCFFYDMGAGGIRLGGVQKTSGNIIDNNIIQRGGRFHASAVAVWIGDNTQDNQISHNDIGDFFYTGVSLGWTWGYRGNCLRNRIEFNKIHKIGQKALADMGGVYTLGTLTGTRVCNNYIYDVKSYAYGGWGLYTDEGSEGVLMENNLVCDTTDGSFHQHYGKENVIRNNILVDSVPYQVAATRSEEHLSFTFDHNIIYWSKGDALKGNLDNIRIQFESNLWFCTTGNPTFGGKSYSEWTQKDNPLSNQTTNQIANANVVGEKTKRDVGGQVADPLFFDVSKRDFRLKPESPALKMGFVPFDYSRAGVYGSNDWTDRASYYQ